MATSRPGRGKFRCGYRDKEKRDFLSAQADPFAGAKREEKASACSVRNDGWRQESWSEGVGPAAGGVEDGENLDVRRAEAVDDDVGCAGDDKLAGGGGAAFAAEFGMGLEGFHSGKDGFDEAVGGGDVVLCDVVACGA
jgi:hypothetical protein